MEQEKVNRRQFNELTSAALGGLLAAAAGCEQAKKEPASVAVEDVAAKEMHVCRGLNTCKGKGKDGKNACAGQGVCATAQAHSCHGENACKGQGGCGANPAENSCRGQGACSVPLMDSAWKKVRARLEQQMTKQGQTLGEAPPKPKS